jgi:DNA-binding GntR family transcriptional regulator
MIEKQENTEIEARRGPRRDEIAANLREAIVSGQLADGDRLIEDKIARDLSTSRGPVREALRQLEAEGLVVSYPYRGAVVLSVSDEEVEHVLIPIRLTLELFSFRKAQERMHDRDFAELAKQVWVMRDAARTGDLARTVDADIQFHELVLACSAQPHTAQLWRSIAPRIRAYFIRDGRLADLNAVADEHQQLLEALQSQDQEVVGRVLERHIAVRTSAETKRIGVPQRAYPREHGRTPRRRRGSD